MKYIRNIFFLILLLGSLNTFAQTDNLTRAYNSMQKGNADSARIYIDKAVQESANKKDPQTWYLRGFIYKEEYKKYESNNIRSGLRDTSVNDLFISYRIDSSHDNKEATFSTLKYLAATYYNDAASNMDSVHFHQAMHAYNKHKMIMKKISTSNFNALDVQFYDALGEIYSGYFFSAPLFETKRKFLDSARKAYDAVLAINPDDFSANYGLGRLYYNQAVNIITNLPVDAGIPEVNKAQDTCAHLARLSLPYLDKAHKLEPLKIEPVKGLEGDYYMLHDSEKFQVNKDLEEKIRQQQSPKK
jgi:tetratricopeptide (TPR) repeat protein